MADTLNVALVSMKNRLGDVAFNLERHRLWLERALEHNPGFVGFPEFSLTGWVEDSDRALSLRSAALKEVGHWARKHKIAIATGMVEACRGRLHNCCVLHGPKGRIGYARKINLVPKESAVYTPGREVPVFDMAGCRMAVATCADASCYEMFALPSLKGAEVIFAPHANSLGAYGGHANGWLAWRKQNWPMYAREACVCVLGVNNAGLFADDVPGDEATKYCGGGAVLDWRGDIVARAHRRTTRKEALIATTLDLAGLRAAREKHYRLNNFRASIVYNRRSGWAHGLNN